jgi:hypothetical protein
MAAIMVEQSSKTSKWEIAHLLSDSMEKLCSIEFREETDLFGYISLSVQNVKAINDGSDLNVLLIAHLLSVYMDGMKRKYPNTKDGLVRFRWSSELRTPVLDLLYNMRNDVSTEFDTYDNKMNCCFTWHKCEVKSDKALRF